MSADTGWEPGTTVTVKEVWQGRVWSARPMTVVRADRAGSEEGTGSEEATGSDGFVEDALVLWLPAGVDWVAPDSPPDREAPPDRGDRIAECLVRGDWITIPRVWKMHSLWFLPRKAQYAIWVCWDPDWKHLGWYVNFQTRPTVNPGARTVHYMDLMLDMQVAPDATWTLRDADHLAGFVARGLASPATAAGLHADVGVLAELATAGAQPFGNHWTGWRPEPDWKRPELPGDWQDAV